MMIAVVDEVQVKTFNQLIGNSQNFAHELWLVNRSCNNLAAYARTHASGNNLVQGFPKIFISPPARRSYRHFIFILHPPRPFHISLQPRR